MGKGVENYIRLSVLKISTFSSRLYKTWDLEANQHCQYVKNYVIKNVINREHSFLL